MLRRLLCRLLGHDDQLCMGAAGLWHGCRRCGRVERPARPEGMAARD